MTENENIKLRRLEDILGESTPERYEIPIYQRNYAWGTAELNQLLQDIWDSAKLNQDRDDARNYYLGTLVLFPKGARVYEVVDGQQRLITLHLIMCALKNNKLTKDALNDDFRWYKSESSSPKLSFTFRQSATDYLKALYNTNSDETLHNGSNADPAKAPAMSSNYDQVIHQLLDILDYDQSQNDLYKKLRDFYQYFRSNTLLAVTYLPQGTDLNHYFEVMNSRGEQLEKHEILKARLFNYLKSDPDKSRLAKLIWEACADLSRYVQMNFTKELREMFFGENWNEFNWKDCDELLKTFKQHEAKQHEAALKQEQQTNQDLRRSLSDILKEGSINADEPKPEDEKEELFYSVIDFPNFLLQVLRVMTGKNTSLDDKQLLAQFDEKKLDEDGIKLNKDFAQKFIFELLHLRFLYDKYVIKYAKSARTSRTDVKWMVRSLEKETSSGKEKSSSSYQLNSTCKEDDKCFITPRVVMAQLMFHVSLPSRSYKHWLTGVLHYVSSESDPASELADYLERLACSYMLDHFLSKDRKDDDYYTIIFKHDGKAAEQAPTPMNLPKYTDGIDFFIFNYLDYHLWKLCCQGKAPAQLNLSDKERKAICQFVFTQRSSIEHFYPQHPLPGWPKLPDDILHSFGNLCLISSSRNSKFSNYPPSDKIKNWDQDKKIDSIKLYLMMTAAQRNLNDAWTEEDIKHHQEQMEEVLSSSFKDPASDTKA